MSDRVISVMYGGLTNLVTVTNVVKGGGFFKPNTGPLVVTAVPHFDSIPIADVEIELEIDDPESRMTGTRVVAGTVLLGPIGAVAGVLARKKVNRGTLTLRTPGHPVYRHKLSNRKEIEKAAKFMEDFEMYRQGEVG